MNLARLVLILCALPALSGVFSGCKHVSTGGKVVWSAAKTGTTVATKTASVAVKTAGAVATTTVSTGAKAAAALTSTNGSAARVPLVILQDLSAGLSREVPWSQGLKLLAASHAAQFNPYLRGFEIVRGSQVIQTTWRKIKAGAPEPELHPGDLVHISSADLVSNPTRAGKGF